MKHARSDYDRIQDPANKIGEDEPVFLIRAKDSSAVDTLEAWCGFNRSNGGDPKLSELVSKHANLMQEWQRVNGCKPADITQSQEQGELL